MADYVSPFLAPALYQSGTGEAIAALSHLVSRPDLVQLDAQGNAQEIATLIVGGNIFEDWETVWIYWSWAEPFSQFKFTCAEREPYPAPGQVLQFAPGTYVQIYLGGIEVINGVIITRQVAYDANQHVVQLSGVSNSWFINRSSIDHPTGDFNGKGFLQIAQEVLAKSKPPVGFATKGDIDNTPFQSGATQEHGETVGQFLERLARLRKIIVSNLPDGRYLFVGEHADPPQGELIEGGNIKKCQCVITVDAAFQEYITRGQSKGNDQQNMTKVSEQEHKLAGSLPQYSVLLTAIEHPVWSVAELAKRNMTEKMWNEDMTKIDCTITVYGWFRPLPTTMASWAVQQLGPTTGHTLWQAGDDVTVHSPMAMLYNQHLKIKSVTWTQDSSNGTQTLLNLVLPQGLNGPPVVAQPIDDSFAKAAAPGPEQTAPM